MTQSRRRRKPPDSGFRFPPLPEAERKLLNKARAALMRIAADPAHSNDVSDLQAVMMFWVMEVTRREELQYFAEIGRAVSNSRKRDQLPTMVAHRDILLRAERLIQQGHKHRGLAGKLAKQFGPDPGRTRERQVKRVLQKYKVQT